MISKQWPTDWRKEETARNSEDWPESETEKEREPKAEEPEEINNNLDLSDFSDEDWAGI